jgi:hypothetical protein
MTGAHIEDFWTVGGDASCWRWRALDLEDVAHV